MSAPTVTLHGIAARYGSTPVLRRIDLELQAGEVVGLVGANGCGKSTLLRVIATLLVPSDGEGSVLGARLGTPEVRAVRPRIALVGHVPALYPELTLAENLEIVARLAGVPLERVDGALHAVGLAGARYRRADRSSHGMQRRLDLSRILVTLPDLVLLDESHAGLDRAAGGLVEAMVQNVRRRGGAALLVSHETERMLPLVDRAVELVDGELRTLEPIPG